MALKTDSDAGSPHHTITEEIANALLERWENYIGRRLTTVEPEKPLVIPGISSLPDEVLLKIFRINTDLYSALKEDERSGSPDDEETVTAEKKENPLFPTLRNTRRYSALMTTLRSSQVCHEWRQILLDSPSVWGSIIDLNILDKNAEFREEVLRRAGSLPLSVRGYADYGTPICDFAFNLIRNHWSQLEWVDVFIDTGSVRLSAQQTTFWKAIAGPAPNLRRFSFVFSSPIPVNPEGLTREATQLQGLWTSPSLPLNLHHPQNRHLTYLVIDGTGQLNAPCTLSQLLEMVSLIPAIKTLSLRRTEIAKMDYGTYQQVQIPSLRELIIEDDYNTCFTLLHHLSPSSLCSLDIYAQDPYDIPTERLWELNNTVKQHLDNRTSYNNVLFIELSAKIFSFTDSYPHSLPEPTVNINVYFNQLGRRSRASFFYNLPMSKFRHIEHLMFQSNLPDLYAIGMDNHGTFMDFFYSLDSLRVLKITTSAFSLLASFCADMDDDDIPIQLPNLQKIELLDPSRKASSRAYLSPHFLEDFVRFHRMRTDRGKPIKQLSIIDCEGDLRKLELCRGLLLTWMDINSRNATRHEGQYTCGSGDWEFLEEWGY